MIKIVCDICEKKIQENCQINVNFNYFGITGFILEINKYRPKTNELNLCVGCAEKVISEIEDLRRIAKLQKEG